MNDFDSKRLSSKQAQEPVVRQSLIKNATDYANNPQRKVPNGLVNINLKNIKRPRHEVLFKLYNKKMLLYLLVVFKCLIDVPLPLYWWLLSTISCN